MAEESPTDPESKLDERSRLPRALVRVSLGHPALCLAFWLGVCLLLTPGVLRLRIETSTDSLLDRESAKWEYYEATQRSFGGDEIIVVMLRSEEPYDPELLEAVSLLSERFRRLSGVRRVDSLSTVPLIESTPEGDLSLEPALAGGIPSTQEEQRVLARRIEMDRVAPGGLISADGRAVGINLVLQEGAGDEYGAILADIDSIESEFHLVRSGVPVFRIAATSRTSRELLIFVPLTVLVIGVLLLLFFRTPQAPVLALGASGIAVWIVMGTMGYLGSPLTISTVILPPVLLALGSAYGMHFLTSAEGERPTTRLRASLDRVALPVMLSGLTTAIGFIAASFVRIQAVRDVSGYGALGVLMLVAVCLTALPAALQLWPLPDRPRRHERWLGPKAASQLVSFVARHPRWIALAGTALLVVAGLGISQVHVETDAVLLFPASDPIRTSYDEIRAELSGISPMNVVIETVGDRSIAEPEVLAAIDGLQAHLAGLPDMGKVLSIADLLRQLNGGFNEDPAQPLPGDEEVIEQYLLLLASKDYYYDLITPDHRAANVLLRVDNNGSGALMAVSAEAESWWRENGPEGTRAQTTGIMYEYARSEDRIAEGQIRGLFFALATIGLIMLMIFSQPWLALLALIPNALPLAVAFGAMGLLGVPLDAGTVFVGSLALGIAVDDTIHELTEFHRCRISGASVFQSLEGAFALVLRPLVYTTVIVAAGFATLGVSSFTYTRNLGVITAGVMVLCLLADLFLLPMLLIKWGDRAPNSSRQSAH